MKLLITRLLSASLFISSVACEEEFSPRSSLEGLRVLAIVTDPIEASVVDPRPMTLSPFVVSTSSITLKHEWTFCPISLGGRAGYACAIPECEVQIPSDTGVIQFHPGQSAGKCL